jgi:hypothetical protein
VKGISSSTIPLPTQSFPESLPDSLEPIPFSLMETGKRPQTLTERFYQSIVDTENDMDGSLLRGEAISTEPGDETVPSGGRTPDASFPDSVTMQGEAPNGGVAAILMEPGGKMGLAVDELSKQNDQHEPRMLQLLTLPPCRVKHQMVGWRQF